VILDLRLDVACNKADMFLDDSIESHYVAWVDLVEDVTESEIRYDLV
jgi:hypothetical protein